MKKRILVLLFLFPVFLFSQTMFEKKISLGSTYTYGGGMCKRANGNILICASSQSNSPQDMSAIAELDQNGDTVWFSRLKYNNGLDLDFVKERPDGKIVIGGASGSGAYKYAWLGLATSTGSLISSLYFNIGNFPSRISDIEIGSDNSIYFAAHVSDVYSGGSVFHRWYIPVVAKVNTSCSSILWSKTYGQHDATTRRSGFACDLEMAPDGNLIVSGIYNYNNNNYSGGSGPSNGYAYIAKYNSSNGANIWSKQRVNDYPSPITGAAGKGHKPMGLAVSPGGYIYTIRPFYNGFGSSADDFVLSKCTPTGDSLWTIKLGSSATDTGLDLIYDSNDKLMITGSTGSSGTVNGLIMQVDTNGVLQYATSVSTGTTTNSFLCIDQMTNGQYAMAGTAYPGPVAFIAVSDIYGSTSCNGFVSGMQTNSIVSGWGTGTVNAAYSLTMTGSSVSSITNTPTFTLGCFSPAPCGGVTAGFSSSTSTACVQTPVAFTNGSSGATTYNWLDDGVSFSSQANPTYSFTYAGTHTVMLIAYGPGCTNISTAVFNVTGIPTLTLTGGTSAACQGSSFTVTASGATTYSWSNGVTTNSVIVTPSVTTTYTVTGTNTAGCSNSAVKTVTVNALPTVSITGNLSICQGTNTALTASGASSYSWSTGASGALISISPTVTTSYSVIGTASNGCKNNYSVTVNVSPQPTITVSGTNTICSGSSTTLSAGGANTYTWNTGAIASTLAVNPVSNTIYSVTGTDVNGCKKTQGYTVTALPLPSMTVSVSNGTICAGQSSTLSASGATAYSWSNGDITNITQVSPLNTSTFNVAGTGTNGCIAIITKTITVNPLPSITVNPANPFLCIGSNATLTAGGATTYTWNTGANSSNIVISPTINTTYTIDGTDANGCSNSSAVTVSVTSSITVAINPTSPQICNGQSVTLNASGASSYTWNTGSNLSSITDTPSGNTSYTVVGSGGGGCNGSAVVTISVNPLPSVNISGSNTICNGQSTSLSAAGASTYTWNTGSNSANISVSPSSNTTYSVSGTSTAGCVGTAITNVTVNALPSVNISGSTAICNGQSTSLSAAGASTYTWNTGSNSANISVSPTSNTTYSVSGTSTAGCVGTAISNVTVNALPSVNISGSTAICNGQSTSLSAAGASTYTWNTGSNSANISVSPSSNTTYNVSGTSTAGCVGTAISSVTVNALPSVNISGSNTICNGQSTSLSAGGASTYTWNTSSNAANISVSPSSNTTYSVSGTSTAGCVGTAISSVTVNALPSVNISGSTAICNGQSTSLSAAGASTYTWNTGSNSANISVSPTSNTTYSVSGTDVNGCNNSAAISVTVNGTPTLTISSTQATLCAGQSATLTAGGASTYTWNTGSNLNSINDNPASTTSYTVSGTDANGCNGNSTFTLIINPLPTISISASNTLLCSGQSSTLNASGAITYSWSNGSTGNPLIITPSVTTGYTVTGTDANSCNNTETISIVVNTCTGIDPMTSPEILVRAYPNPFSETLTIESPATIKITVYNVLGQAVLIMERQTGKILIETTTWAKGIYTISAEGISEGTPIPTVIKVIKD